MVCWGKRRELKRGAKGPFKSHLYFVFLGLGAFTVYRSVLGTFSFALLTCRPLTCKVKSVLMFAYRHAAAGSPDITAR